MTEELKEMPKDIEKISDYLEQEFNLGITQHAVLVEELIKLKEESIKETLTEVEKMIKEIYKFHVIDLVSRDMILEELQNLKERK